MAGHRRPSILIYHVEGHHLGDEAFGVVSHPPCFGKSPKTPPKKGLCVRKEWNIGRLKCGNDMFSHPLMHYQIN